MMKNNATHLLLKSFIGYPVLKPDKNSFAVKLRHGAQKYECTIEYDTDGTRAP